MKNRDEPLDPFGIASTFRLDTKFSITFKQMEPTSLMTESRVSIYGSSPNVRLVKSDVAYFSNFASLNWSSEEIKRFSPQNHSVVSYSYSTLDSIKHSERLKLANLQLEAQEMDHSWCLIQNPRRRGMLELANPRANLVSPEEIIRLLISTSKSLPPFIDPWHLTKGFLDSPRLAFKMLGIATKKGLRPTSRKTNRVPPYFRASTGLTAVAFAISRHPQAREFVLSGFDFDKRLDHSIWAETKPDVYFKNHIVADKVLLRKLSRAFPIRILGHEYLGNADDGSLSN